MILPAMLQLGWGVFSSPEVVSERGGVVLISGIGMVLVVHVYGGIRKEGYLKAQKKRIVSDSLFLGCHAGRGGEIRTHGRFNPTSVFKTGALNHSATPPCCVSCGGKKTYFF